MAKRTKQHSDNQVIQQELVERGRALPGVADVIDVYGRLSMYVQVVNAQPGQIRNATGGNPS
jgi:hypothetical protein